MVGRSVIVDTPVVSHAAGLPVVIDIHSPWECKYVARASELRAALIQPHRVGWTSSGLDALLRYTFSTASPD